MFEIIKPLLIIGTGGFAADVTWIAEESYREIFGFIKHGSECPESLFGKPVFQNLSELDDSILNFSFIIALGDNTKRQECYEQLSSEYPSIHFATIIHPSTTVSPRSVIRDGSVISANSVIGPNVEVGRFCKIGSLVLLSHGSHLKDFCFVGPGCVVAGDVSIGEKHLLE